MKRLFSGIFAVVLTLIGGVLLLSSLASGDLPSAISLAILAAGAAGFWLGRDRSWQQSATSP